MEIMCICICIYRYMIYLYQENCLHGTFPKYWPFVAETSTARSQCKHELQFTALDDIIRDRFVDLLGTPKHPEKLENGIGWKRLSCSQMNMN